MFRFVKPMSKSDVLIGFIGQGWIGKHYADDFEKRGHKVVRYGLEEPYKQNGDKIKDCDIVFIAVPTPSTLEGFDDSIVRQAIKKVGSSSIAVIKSTLLPGTTQSIQKENPGITVTHSPEFLREATAAYDAANPARNIIGITKMSDELIAKAGAVIDVLPKAPFEHICHSQEAEFIKYGGNCLLAIKVLFMNMMHDMIENMGGSWDRVGEAMAADSRLGDSHWQPVHSSSPGMKPGRGFGGHCFIKDFAAFREMYEKQVGDKKGLKMLDSIVKKNIKYLVESEKDMDILKGVYGEDVLTRNS